MPRALVGTRKRHQFLHPTTMADLAKDGVALWRGSAPMRYVHFSQWCGPFSGARGEFPEHAEARWIHVRHRRPHSPFAFGRRRCSPTGRASITPTSVCSNGCGNHYVFMLFGLEHASIGFYVRRCESRRAFTFFPHGPMQANIRFFCGRILSAPLSSPARSSNVLCVCRVHCRTFGMCCRVCRQSRSQSGDPGFPMVDDRFEF